MIQTHEALAIIPARGGSKRLPGKNKKMLDGKPLISWTIEAALQSEKFKTILVSSDSDEILDIAKGYEGVLAEKRPAELANDTSKVIELVRYYADNESYALSHNVIGLLLPTCPFRSADHIREGFDLLTSDVDVVVSATEYGFPPQKSMTIHPDSNLLVPSEDMRKGNTRSQDLEKVYHDTGALYLAWWESFNKYKSWYKGNGKLCLMPRQNFVDIDTAFDWAYAEFLIKQGLIN